jgi:signal transduction histidine kinase
MTNESIRVLLVEDNLGDARLLYEGLEEALPGQFQMTHVRRLSEALEFLWKEPCDVVLLDLGLPDSHGIDTLILTRAQAPSAPIVVLTGFQDEALGDEALQEGAQDYLVKGQVDSQQLARSMRYAIARKAANEALVGQGVALATAEVLRRSRRRLLTAHERVRRDIAAQLHDGVEAKLESLTSRLHQLLQHELLKKESGALEMSREQNAELEELTAQIERQVDVLSGRLYPSALRQGLAAGFQSFHDEFATTLALDIQVDKSLTEMMSANRDLVSERLGLIAYRIAEEALTNVVKHAQVSQAAVRLDVPRAGWLRLSVRDDGRGFDVEHVGAGLGLGTMRDYAEAADGEFSVASQPGEGTVVTALLPLSPESARHCEAAEQGVR